MMFEQLGRQLPCPYCGARRYERCRTASGLRASRMHEARTRELYEAWREGFHEGLAEALYGVKDRLSRAHLLTPQVLTELVKWAVAWDVDVEGFNQ